MGLGSIRSRPKVAAPAKRARDQEALRLEDEARATCCGRRSAGVEARATDQSGKILVDAFDQTEQAGFAMVVK